jgi:ABC-2 type transport system permease protein
MIAVFKHELRTAFNGFSAYLFCAFFLVFVGIGAVVYNIQSSVANFEYVLKFVCIGMAVLIPVLTMRSIAEERKQKTDQLLYSLPLKTSDVVLGKYFALVVVFLVPMCIISIYPLIFSKYGEVYLPTSYGSLLAFFLMCSALIAVGIFISSLTDNQGFAAGISIAVMIFNYYSVTLAEQVSSSALGAMVALMVIAALIGFLIRALTRNDIMAIAVGIALAAVAAVIYFVNSTLLENLLPNIMKSLSLFEQFYTFVNGVFDLRSIVFFLSVIVFFLFLTVQSLEKRRYN